MRFLAILLLVLMGCGGDKPPVSVIPDCPDDPVCQPLPLPSPDPEPTPSPPSPSPTPSPSPSPSPSPEPSPSPTPPPLDVDSLFSATSGTKDRVREYVRKFISDGELVGIDVVELLSTGPTLEIRIASLDGWGAGVIGLCESGSASRRLTLDPDYFEVQGEVASRILFHHEMGHCVLFRGHRTEIGLIPDSSGHSHAMSVMYPIIMGAEQYNFHEPYYVGELFEQLSLTDEPSVYVCPGL